MAEIDVGGAANGHHAVNVVDIEDQTHPASCFPTVPFLQKLLAEVLGTYFVIFAGCAAVVVNTDKDKIVSLPGISIVWGLVVMVMVYSVGHISGAHFNPAVTIAFASCNRFPLKQLLAEVLGTYFVIFAGCAAVVVNTDKDKIVSLPGISIVWGLVVMVMVYSVGHISGAHFNPAVTIAFASCNRFPLKQVPAYVAAQVLGSTLASGTLRLIFNGRQDHFAGTLPVGSDLQSLVLEFIITFYLMFVISGVATDNRAIGELAGLAVGATVLLNVMFAGPISGASMNPARSLGPAIVSSEYRSIWIYMLGPIAGAISGAWVYNVIRFTDKPLREITKSSSFLRYASSRNGSKR